MYLAENLKFLLYKHDLTITELARRTGVPKSTIHNWINGAVPRKILLVVAISEYFKLECRCLIFEKINE